MRKCLSWLFFLICFFISEKQFASSPFSSAGIGSEHFLGTVHTRAMAGVFLRDSSLQLTNIENPATIWKSRMTLFQIGAEGYQPLTKKGNSFSQYYKLGYFALSFPVTSRLATLFSVVPETDYNYDWTPSTETVNYKGSGGLSSIRVSTGYKWSPSFSFGLEMAYLFGRLTQTRSNITDTLKIELQGFTFKPTINYRRNINKTLFFEGTSFIRFGTLNKNDNQNGRKQINFPLETSVNFGFGINQRWFLGTRYTFKNNHVFAHTAEFAPIGLRTSDKHSWSLGGSYFLKPNTTNKKHTILLGGFEYGQAGINSNGKEVTESMASVGIVLPFPNSPSMLSFLVSIGTRSEVSQLGIPREDFVNLAIGFNFMKKWFVKNYEQ